MNGRETGVMKMSLCWKQFRTLTAMLVLCIALSCSIAGAALYDIDLNGDSNVLGLEGAGVGDLNGLDFGSVEVNATNDYAIGVYGDGLNVVINGAIDVNGNISALATNYAYAIDSNQVEDDGGSVTTGALDGTISATARDSYAYGIAGTDVNIGSIGSNARITAIAANGNASGLSAGSIIIGAMDGNVSAISSGGSNATGIGGGSIVIGNIGSTAKITALAESSDAIALWGGSIVTGDINGTISAEVTDGPYAYALYADGEGGDINVGNINGTITAKAAEWKAVALYSSNGDIYTGDIAGRIDANSGGSSAFGLRTDGEGSLIKTGVISGTINAEAGTVYGGDRAFGFRSAGSIEIEGIDSGASITATAHAFDEEGINGGNEAYGIYATDDISIGYINSGAQIIAIAEVDEAAGIYSNDGSVTIGAIDGNVFATAVSGEEPGTVYGIYAADSVTTGNIGGTISATMTAGSDAFGIYADDGNVTTGAISGNIIAQASPDYESSGDNAYGISAGTNVNINGEMSGTISAYASNNNAYGIFAEGSVTTGAISGLIEATADGYNEGDNAYGIYGVTSVTTGAITGEIDAYAWADNAYGIRSDGDVNISSIGVGGQIYATADDGSNAYGIYGGGNLVTIGDISGTIDAYADNDNAYGIRSDGNLVIASISNNGTISAYADDEDAFGLDAGGYMTIGDINGTISATADSREAIAVRSVDTLTIGTINGTITAEVYGGNRASALRSMSDMIIGGIGSTAEISATASNNGAMALVASDSITIGDIAGDITATAGNDNAYGIYADSNVNITGTISGKISAIAGDESAYGIYSNNYNVTTGAITGTIFAQSSDEAYGILSDSGDVTTGAIDGTIKAIVTDGDWAVGLYAEDNLTVESIGANGLIIADAEVDDAYGLYAAYGNINVGAIDGNIIVTANDGDDAAGIYAEGAEDGTGNVTIGSISGTISATAGADDAYGIYANNGDITIGAISGTISATAGEYDAYGIYADDGNVTTGAISGTITAATTGGDYSNVAGIYGYNSVTVNGDISGRISATAFSDDDEAGVYGIGSDGDVDINGVISGTIEATSGDHVAYGIYAYGSVTTGAISGNISATVGNDDSYAFGVFGYDSVTTGAITGTISATADGVAAISDGAYGIASDGNVVIESIGTTGRITALASDDDAYGIYAGPISDFCDLDVKFFSIEPLDGPTGNVITGDISGTISATAGNDGAYGIYGDNSVTTGAIGGTISAIAGDDAAYGIYSNNSVTTGAISGAISATAGDDTAFGIYSDGSVTTGAISGTISATARSEDAYGIYGYNLVTTGDISGTISAAVTHGDYAIGIHTDSDVNTGNIIHTGNISGNIIASADDDEAYGIYASTNTFTDTIDENEVEITTGTVETGDISGHITATAGGYGAYGINGHTVTTGAISGTISATAGQDYAVGLLSTGALTTGAISGEVSAHADGNFAYGILAYGPMNVTVNGGTIRATADGGEYVAAIQSGRFTESGLEGQDVDDTVNIVAGSSIIGDIDLGGSRDVNGVNQDHDVMTLSGTTGTSSLSYDIYNVEDITITGGTWRINGSIINNAEGVQVDGGVLGGEGWLENVYVNDGGTLNPGNSVGIIHVNNLTFNSGSTYQVEIDDSGNADKVEVSGMATLDDESQVSVVALESIRHSHEGLLIIDAPAVGEESEVDPCLSGQFDGTVLGDKLFTTFGLRYEPTDGDVFLDVTKKSYADPEIAKTDNERKVGRALDSLIDSGTNDDVLDYFDSLGTGDGKQAKEALDQLMPQDVLGLPEVMRNVMNQYSDSTLDHAGSVRGSKQYAAMTGSSYLLASASNSQAAPAEVDKWMPYAKGFGTWGNRDGESDVVGYDFHNYGLMGGMDKLISENTLVGFNIGGSSGKVDYDQSGTDADLDSFLLSLYGSYFKDEWHIDLTAAYAHTWYNTERRISFMNQDAEADYEGDAFNIATEFGYNLGGTDMLLEPVAGLGYTYVQQDSYTESGAGSLNLNVDSETMDGLYSRLGLRLAKEFRCEKNPNMIIVPKASAFWIHDFADNAEFGSQFVNGGSFSTDSLDPIEDSLKLSGGLNVYLSKSTQLFVDYTWQTSSEINFSTVQAGAQFKF
jgi:uncharacterized protein with beta-barrel porin domain